MSIDKRELMINNWVYWNKEPYQIDIDHFKLYLVFEPIPLTPQLLSKIEGFKEIGSTGDFYNQEVDIGISKDEEGNLSLYNNHDLEVHPNELKYLHQLQNIIFIMVGVELKINL